MSLSVTRILDKSFDTFIRFFSTYSLLFLLVLLVKIALFSTIFTSYFFNQSISFFKAILTIIDLFGSYDNRIVWPLLYPLFFYVAVLIINSRSQAIDTQRATGWANFFTIRLWGSYLLWNLFFYAVAGIVVLVGMMTYALFHKYDTETFFEWLRQQDNFVWYILLILPILLAQIRFFLVPYLLVQTQLPIIHVIKKSFFKTRGYVWFIIRTMVAGLLVVGIFNVIIYTLSLYLQHLSSLWSYKIGFYLFFNALQTTFFCAMSMLFVAYTSEEILKTEGSL